MDSLSVLNLGQTRPSARPQTINEEAGLPENWVPSDQKPIIPSIPQFPEDSSNRYLTGSLPPVYQHDTSFVGTAYKTSVAPSLSLMPLGLQGNPQTNAAIQSTTNIAAAASVVAPDNDVTVSDGLVHGLAEWPIDPAYVILRDDFITPNPNTTLTDFNSQIQWHAANGGDSSYQSMLLGNYATPPTMGVVTMINSVTANKSNFLTTYMNTSSNPSQGWALFDYPGWKMVWVFGVGRSFAQSSPPAFSFAQTSMYVGMGNYPAMGSGLSNGPINTTTARPAQFCGLRYDTDPSHTYSLTSVAAGTGVYQGTLPAANSLTNQKVTITGFTNAANNGTFLVTSNTTTAITVVNAASVVETHAGSLATLAIGDSTFKFEYNGLVNIYTETIFRNNTPGTVFDTGLVPTEGRLYRLEISCTVSGTINFLLVDGFTSVTTTMTIVPSFVSSDSIYLRFAAGNGDSTISVNPMAPPWTEGSKVTISGGAVAAYNGTWNVALQTIAATQGVAAIFPGMTFSTTQSAGASFTMFPAMFPLVSFGNDTNTSANAAGAKGIFVDYFGFVWNPGVGGGTATANSLLARYF